MLELAESVRNEVAAVARVFGQFTFTNLSFDVDAALLADGTIAGAISWTIDPDFEFTEEVNCIVVDGDLAWVGTEVVASTAPGGSSGDLAVGALHTWIFRDDPDEFQAQFTQSDILDCADQPPIEAFSEMQFVPVTSGGFEVTGG